jgi:hypothetical protein
MSCEDEHHGHGHGGHGDDHDHDGHNHIAPIATFPSQSLLSKVDCGKITGLNISNPREELRRLFKNEATKYELKPVIKSDCDAQLLINIPFTNSSVKLFSLIIRSNGDLYCPRTIKLYKNDTTIDFDNVNDKKPTFQLEHPQVGVMYNEDESMPDTLDNDNEFVEHYLPRHKFTGVYNLTIFIEDVYGDEDETHLHSLDLRGEYTELNKNPVITIYESAPNPADHQKITETTLNMNGSIN